MIPIYQLLAITYTADVLSRSGYNYSAGKSKVGFEGGGVEHKLVVIYSIHISKLTVVKPSSILKI